MIRQSQTGGFVTQVQGREPSTLFCSSCLQPIKPGAQFCPHCGHVVDSPRPGSRWTRRIFLLVGILMGLVLTLVIELLLINPAPRMDAHYLSRTLQADIRRCSEELDQLRAERLSAVTTQRRIESTLPDIENFASRLKTAIGRGDDENRWPIKVAGRTFNRPDAIAVSARLQDYLGRAHQNLADEKTLVSVCDRTIRLLQRDHEQMQMLASQLQQDPQGQALQQSGAAVNQVQDELNQHIQQVPQIRSFTPTDLDALVK